MTTFQVRQAQPADLPALTTIYRRASLSNKDDAPNLLAHPEVLVLSDEAIRTGRMRLAVDPAGTIVGFATVQQEDGFLELEDLFVDPDWMRQGIATLLIQDAMTAAQQRGISRIEVTANPHADAFYRQVGFQPAGEVQTRFGPGQRMSLKVNPGQ
jgi:N-acetylglutamate synthase-like GNAT family acetyltransferase